MKFPLVGVCGLSCRLCPSYHSQAASRCEGCKSESRMAVGCPFITCARKKDVEFCWDCGEDCERWRKHREAGKKVDSFKCYQKLEDDIAFIKEKGVLEFEKTQKEREQLLKSMLEINEGRSKSYYCIAATVLEIGELGKVIKEARKNAQGMEMKERAKVLHGLLDAVAEKKGYLLRLRKG